MSFISLVSHEFSEIGWVLNEIADELESAANEQHR
jgi:hypothetical protein